jgi:hypothetical protein
MVIVGLFALSVLLGAVRTRAEPTSHKATACGTSFNFYDVLNNISVVSVMLKHVKVINLLGER